MSPLVILDPLNRGLKLLQKLRTLRTLSPLEVVDPLNRGLKHTYKSISKNNPPIILEVVDPLNRGLKPETPETKFFQKTWFLELAAAPLNGRSKVGGYRAGVPWEGSGQRRLDSENLCEGRNGQKFHVGVLDG